MEQPDKQLPKTNLCCGLKPKRTYYQTGFRDDEGHFVMECRKKCGKRVSVTNQYRGWSKCEFEATFKWNELVVTNPPSSRGKG